MSRTLEAALRITAKDMTGPAFRSAESRARGLRTELAGIGKAALGVAAAYVGFDAAARAIGAVGRAAYETDKQTKALAVTAGASAAEMDRARIALTLGAADAKTSSRDLTDASMALVQAGQSLDVAAASATTIGRAAKAAGAELADMSGTAAALLQNMKATPETLERFFDIAIKGGKAGQFELKDMATELPSLTASMAKLGSTGEEGFTRLVGMLQIVREVSGSSSEAANNLKNLLEKMTAQETVKNFKKMGVNIEKVFKDAQRDGRDFTDAFLAETAKVTKGDPFKVGQLIPDMQARTALVALLEKSGKYKELLAALRASIGETGRDFEKMTAGAAGGIDRLSASWSTFLDVLAHNTKPAIDSASNSIADGLDGISETMTAARSTADLYRQLTGEQPPVPLVMAADEAGYAAANAPGAKPGDRYKATEAVMRRAGRERAASIGRLNGLQLRQLDAESEAGYVSRVGAAKQAARAEVARFMRGIDGAGYGAFSAPVPPGAPMAVANGEFGGTPYYWGGAMGRMGRIRGDGTRFRDGTKVWNGGTLTDPNDPFGGGFRLPPGGTTPSVARAVGSNGIPVPMPKPGEIKAEVSQPIPVEIGKGQVNVTIRVEGPGTVVGASAFSAGNLITNVGTSMPQVEHVGGIGSR